MDVHQLANAGEQLLAVLLLQLLHPVRVAGRGAGRLNADAPLE